MIVYKCVLCGSAQDSRLDAHNHLIDSHLILRERYIGVNEFFELVSE